MRGTRRGFLGALAGLPALVGLGKRAAPAEPGTISGLTEQMILDASKTLRHREMTTVILRWADGKEENLSVARPLQDVIYMPRYVEPPWVLNDDAFPTPPSPTIEKVTFRFLGRSLITDPTLRKTIPIYEEAFEHALYSRGPGRGYVCRDCGLKGAAGTDWDRLPCKRASAWNVGALKVES